MNRLFENRSLQVKMIKHGVNEGPTATPSAAPSTDQIETLFVSLSVCVGALILVYMGGDTIRQVAVHTATKVIK